MKKVMCLFAVCIVFCFSSMAQKNTMSFNYLNLGKADKNGWNSGVGVQVKIHLKNNWYLLPYDKSNYIPYLNVGVGYRF